MPFDLARYALLGVTLFTVLLLLIVLMRVAKMASGRRAAVKRSAENRGESALLSMALQDALWMPPLRGGGSSVTS